MWRKFKIAYLLLVVAAVITILIRMPAYNGDFWGTTWQVLAIFCVAGLCVGWLYVAESLRSENVDCGFAELLQFYLDQMANGMQPHMSFSDQKRLADHMYSCKACRNLYIQAVGKERVGLDLDLGLTFVYLPLPPLARASWATNKLWPDQRQDGRDTSPNSPSVA